MAVNAQAHDTTYQEGEGTQPGVRPPRRRDVRSTFLITGLRTTGKSLGIAKTLVIAAWFGASGALDAFWVAYMIPQLMPGLVLGVVTTAFIPSFMRSAGDGSKTIDWRGLNTVFTVVALAILAISLSVVFGRHALVHVMAPGLPGDVHDLAANLTALMAVAVLIFGINAILSAVMQATRRFGLMSLESVVTNVVIIAGAVFLSETYGVYGLAYAVIGGFGIHMLLLLWGNRDLVCHKLRPAFHFAHEDFRGSIGHMLPLLVGFFGSVGMTIVDRIFVSTLESGAISILVYASMIALLPMEVFGQAVFTAFYPGLSQDHAEGNLAAMREAQVRGIRLLLLVLVPTTVGLVMAADAIVTLLLERGAFSAAASNVTAATLAALAIGLPVRAFNYFNFRVLHARREPWTAVGIGLFGVCVNILLDMLLIGPYGVVGIALATSLAMAACAVLSTILLQRRQKASIMRPLLRPLANLLLMVLVLAAVAGGLLELIARFSPQLVRWQALLLDLAAFIPAGVAFVLVGYALQVEEIRSLARFAGHRLNRSTG